MVSRVALGMVISVMCAFSAAASGQQKDLPPLPKGLTSFGAAISDGWLYVYGGHAGRAHAYSVEDQSRAFQRLNLREGTAWESLGEAPPVQGMAFVAHGDKLYRFGGLLVENAQGEEDKLRSLDEAACYDPIAKSWAKLPPLPEPRSSLDAVVLGDEVFVIGGWTLKPGDEPVWLDTAWRMDLTASEPQWRPLAAPKFQRRALAVGQCDGKIYCLGGMQSNGEITRQVAVYDPKLDRWSEGPEMPGEGMDGFAAACFNVGGRLVATSYSGQVITLSEDHARWEATGKLQNGRFFHRLLSVGDDAALVVGGANMETGKHLQIEWIK